MQQHRMSGYGMLPPVVKNLILLNVVMYIATLFFKYKFRIDLEEILGLHNFDSPLFRPYQLITHMFMHASIGHIFFNMFALWMFGYAIENLWGGKRFFIFYFVSGLGAAFFNLFVSWLYIHPMLTAFHSFEAMPTVDAFSAFVTQYFPELFQTTNIADVIQAWKLSPDNGQIAQSAVHFLSGQIYPYINIPMVGASGAIYGVLLAFGMLFPNTVIYLYFLFPLKAKWFVIIFGALELYMGLSMPGDHVAHFAHLGGMIFGFFLILYWKKKDRFRFY